MNSNPDPNPTPGPGFPPQPATRTLHRSSNKMVGGVIAGLAEYFGIDVNLARLVAFVALLFSFGAIFIAYVAAWVILPGPGGEPSYLAKQRQTSPPPPPPPAAAA